MKEIHGETFVFYWEKNQLNVLKQAGKEIAKFSSNFTCFISLVNGFHVFCDRSNLDAAACVLTYEEFDDQGVLIGGGDKSTIMLAGGKGHNFKAIEV